MKKIREKWIDNAKGIAIILVIIGHTSQGLWDIWDMSFLFGIHLVVFFLLSGYNIEKREITGEYLNSKFSRLMIPYFYTCLAIVITDIFNSWFWDGQNSIETITGIVGKDLLRSFFASGSIKSFGKVEIGTVIGAIWFLPALYFSLIIFQFLLNKIENDKYLGIMTASLTLLAYISARFLWLPFSIQSGLFATFFLWIGYEIKKYSIIQRFRWNHLIIAFLCLYFCIKQEYCYIGFVKAYMNDLIISTIGGLSGSLIIYFLSKADSKGLLLSYIGRISLTVLCVHLYAMETMGWFFRIVLNHFALSGYPRQWAFVALHILYAVLIAHIIELIKTALRSTEVLSNSGLLINKDNSIHRDDAIDIAKGIFIVLMLVGHFTIDVSLRSIIYSCHMMAFVFFSGYFYSKNRSLKDSAIKMTSGFIVPYIVFIICFYILNAHSWSKDFLIQNTTKYVMGLSFTNKFFKDIPSVGPVYFILMLFLTRFFYTVVDKLAKTRLQLNAAVFAVSILGLTLGKTGWWLPWSADISCYSIIFYHIGRICKETEILRTIKEWHFFYFILSPVWAYMIYAGSMEIAVRDYGEYGIVLLGSTAGILTVYKLSSYLKDAHLIIASVLKSFGQCTLIILIVHTLLRPQIGTLLEMRFDKSYLPYMILNICIQLIIAVLTASILNITKKRFMINR